MPYSWQLTKGRQLGLQKQDFVYGHQLQKLPNSAHPSKQPNDVQPKRDYSAERAEAERAEAEIYALPKSDSSDESLSAPNSPPSEQQTLPPSKRRKTERRRIQHNDPTGPVTVKKEPDLAGIAKFDLASSDPSSNHHSNRMGKAPSSSLRSMSALKDDPDEPFAEFNASQSKSTYKYERSTTNIHKAAPVKQEKKLDKIKPEKPVPKIKTETDVTGFKKVDFESICAAGIGLKHHCLRNELILSKSYHLKRGTSRPVLSHQLDYRKVRDRSGQTDGQRRKKQTVEDHLVKRPLESPSSHQVP
ncbi:MAG: hypothetical protein Q9213_008366 [Squamulea squamosa]